MSGIRELECPPVPCLCGSLSVVPPAQNREVCVYLLHLVRSSTDAPLLVEKPDASDAVQADPHYKRPPNVSALPFALVMSQQLPSSVTALRCVCERAGLGAASVRDVSTIPIIVSPICTRASSQLCSG